MRILALIALTLFSSYCFGEDWEERCSREADIFGGQNLFSPNCEVWMVKNATVRKMTDKFLLHSWRNVSILRTPEGMFIVSGENSTLIEILDAVYDVRTKKLYLLNQNKKKKQLLVFNGKSHGDVAPAKVIDSPLINKVERLELTEDENVILTKSETEDWKWDITQDARVAGELKPLKEKKEEVIEKKEEEKSFLSIFGF